MVCWNHPCQANLERAGLKGIQRVPALCFPYQTSSLQDLNLAQYEVVPMEPLHDLKEHISNLLKELPKHLTNGEKVLFEEVVEAVISVKEKLIRGSDYLPSVLCCSGLAPWRQLSPHYQKTVVHSRRTLWTAVRSCRETQPPVHFAVEQYYILSYYCSLKSIPVSR